MIFTLRTHIPSGLVIHTLHVRTCPSGRGFRFSGHQELTISRYDFRNKRVGVIGNGSSSIQIVPSLQPVEGVKMTVFMRSPTWISSNAFGDAAMAELGLGPDGCKSDSSPRHVDSSGFSVIPRCLLFNRAWSAVYIHIYLYLSIY